LRHGSRKKDGAPADLAFDYPPACWKG